MYIRTSSFVSLETTFYIACIQQGFVDPKCNRDLINHSSNLKSNLISPFELYKLDMYIYTFNTRIIGWKV